MYLFYFSADGELEDCVIFSESNDAGAIKKARDEAVYNYSSMAKLRAIFAVASTRSIDPVSMLDTMRPFTG